MGDVPGAGSGSTTGSRAQVLCIWLLVSSPDGASGAGPGVWLLLEDMIKTQKEEEEKSETRF